MSWFSKVGFFLAVLCVSWATAARVYFPAAAEKGGMQSRMLADNTGMSSVEIRFSLPHLDLNQVADGFDKVAAPGVVPLENPGLPELFSTGRLVAVPPGYELDVQWVSQDVKEFPNVLVQPAQEKYRCDCDANRKFAFNKAAYGSQGVYPAKQVVVEEVGKIQGIRLVRVGFYPAQYDFAKRTLKVTHNAEFKIAFRQLADAVTAPVTLTKSNFALIRSAAANGQALGREVVRVDDQELLLVLSADSLVDSLAPFVAWKKSKGMMVEVVSFTKAGGTKEKAKEYIANYFKTAAVKPSYLLFVGNKDSMPGFKESTKSGAAATDFTYAVLTKDDKLPAVPYGRFLANNVDELKVVMNKAIEYERNPEKGAEWYSSATTIASDEGFNPSDKEYAQQVAEALKAHTYRKADAFTQGDETATIDNITGALKEGRSWLAYFGHGSGTSWGSTNEDFSNTTVGTLENDNRLPVIIDVACQNGSWMNLDKPFGKAWVSQQHNGQNAGAVAFYGGSVNISWHPPAIMSVGIAKAHFEKPVYHLGGSVMAGQLYLIEKKGMVDEALDNYKWYNLFGDPSMHIRTTVPQAYDVKSETKAVGRNVVITVIATDISGKPLANVTASILKQGAETLAVAKTGADGTAQLTVPNVVKLETGTTLTTTGYNLETHEVVMN